MRKSKTILFLSILSLIVSACGLWEDDYHKKVIVHGVRNCIESKNSYSWLVRPATVDLSPGKYEFVIIDGAISLWSHDGGARKLGLEPWVSFAFIDISDQVYKLGRYEPKASKALAFESQKDKKITVEIDKLTTVRLWVEDEWKGQDHCQDNRGKLTVGIIKLT